MSAPDAQHSLQGEVPDEVAFKNLSYTGYVLHLVEKLLASLGQAGTRESRNSYKMFLHFPRVRGQVML
jgi:hypothetical protein